MKKGVGKEGVGEKAKSLCKLMDELQLSATEFHSAGMLGSGTAG
jgi:hypothetical protein